MECHLHAVVGQVEDPDRVLKLAVALAGTGAGGPGDDGSICDGGH